jgi:vacuolar-type H+-ATPase subunit D/Vma8
MTKAAIKKQVEDYLPLLTNKQQELVLEMIKAFLNMDQEVKRISRKKYNKELNEAVTRMDSGQVVTHKEALRELSKW